VSAVSQIVSIRRELRTGDEQAIVELHRRVYVPEFGMGERFLTSVAASIERARARDWPNAGGVWLIEGEQGLAGSLALTDAQARAAGLTRLALVTFSDLVAAAHIYRRAGFVLRSEEPMTDWDRPILYQHYELDLVSRTGNEPSP
jgi:hypothetical protein